MMLLFMRITPFVQAARLPLHYLIRNSEGGPIKGRQAVAEPPR
jgi:hypothetical protein